MSRTVTLLGFGLIAVALVACQVAGLLSDRVPTIGRVVSLVVSRRPARWLLLGGWLWAGWHLLVRSHAGA